MPRSYRFFLRDTEHKELAPAVLAEKTTLHTLLIQRIKGSAGGMPASGGKAPK